MESTLATIVIAVLMFMGAVIIMIAPTAELSTNMGTNFNSSYQQNYDQVTNLMNDSDSIYTSFSSSKSESTSFGTGRFQAAFNAIDLIFKVPPIIKDITGHLAFDLRIPPIGIYLFASVIMIIIIFVVVQAWLKWYT